MSRLVRGGCWVRGCFGLVRGDGVVDVERTRRWIGLHVLCEDVRGRCGGGRGYGRVRCDRGDSVEIFYPDKAGRPR